MKGATVESDSAPAGGAARGRPPAARAGRQPKAIEELVDRLRRAGAQGMPGSGLRWSPGTRSGCAAQHARRSSETATDGPKPDDAKTMMTANELNEIYQAELEVLAPSAGAIRRWPRRAAGHPGRGRRTGQPGCGPTCTCTTATLSATPSGRSIAVRLARSRGRVNACGLTS